MSFHVPAKITGDDPDGRQYTPAGRHRQRQRGRRAAARAVALNFFAKFAARASLAAQ